MKYLGILFSLFILGYLSHKYKQDFFKTISMKDFVKKGQGEVEEANWLNKLKKDFNSPLEGSNIDEGGDLEGDDMDDF